MKTKGAVSVLVIAIAMSTLIPYKVSATSRITCTDSLRSFCETLCHQDTALNYNVEFCVSNCNRFCRPY